MYFVDRVSLGKKLADGVAHARATDAIIVCLKNSSLLTTISMATYLRAWIYQLEFQTIMNPMDETKILGAVTTEGEFVLNPVISRFELESIEMEFAAQLEDRKREALSILNRRDTQNFDKHIMNGRTVILTGDVLFDALGLAIAKTIMKPLSPKEIVGTAGNVTADVSDVLHLESDTTNILDVLPSASFDDGHYFEKSDPYSDEEKQKLATYISNYWVKEE